MAEQEKSKQQKRIEKLERKKLELEIAHLREVAPKKNRWLVIIQALTPIVAIIVTFLVAYLGILKDGSENKAEATTAYNEALVKENRTVLEIMDLEKRKDTLGNQIKGFEDERTRLISQSDSARTVIENQRKEKTLLAGNIAGLRSSKRILEKELDFAPVYRDMQYLKKDANPDNSQFKSVLSKIQNNSSFYARIIDTLDEYSKIHFADHIGVNFLLYQGTADSKYKERVFDTLRSRMKTMQLPSDEIPGLKGKTASYVSVHYSLPDSYINVLSSQHWTSDERKKICQIVIKGYNELQEDQRGTPEIASILLLFKHLLFHDRSINLVELDYEFYWDFLRENRDYLLNQDYSETEEIKACAMNISLQSQQLLFAIKYYCPNPKIFDVKYRNIRIALSSAQFPMSPHLDDWHYYKALVENMKSPFLYDPKSWCEFYAKHSNKIDSWILGDFERFRNDKEAYLKVVEEGTL